MGQAATTIAGVSDLVLESRLVDWSREYGGGRYVSLGFSTGEHVLAKLIAFGGFLPGSSAPRSALAMTPADEVEQAVRRLAKFHPAHAQVIRGDYMRPNQAMDARLADLRRKGIKMGKTRYYQFLESAKLYVAQELGL